ncbi:MAG: hypothetical protein D6730_17005, partial [Bacteroidetes bacterium]
ELSEEELKALTARSSQSLKELAMTTYQQILNKGLQKGIQEERQRTEAEKRQIIARMLREGLLSPSQIAKLFNLPEEAVLKIREKLENQ